MRHRVLSRLLLVGLALIVLSMNVPLAVADDHHAAAPRIAPIGSQPGGQTYGRWAAEWWQWLLGVPAATNPLTDTTGQHCAQRQVDRVWFLAGAPSPDAVVRACEVP